MKLLRNSALLILIFFFLFAGVSSATENSRNLDREIRSAYLNADYSKTAKLLKKHIKELRNTLDKDAKNSGAALQYYKESSSLAHLYTWRLNRPEKAQIIYRRIIEFKLSDVNYKDNMSTELIFMGEIFEKKGELSLAIEYYNKFLDELSTLMEKLGEEEESEIFLRELTNLIKYRIDTLKAKVDGAGDFDLLLNKLKLPLFDGIVQFMVVFLTPESIYDYLKPTTGLPNHIKESPMNIGSMITNYLLVLGTFTGKADDSSKMAIDAFLVKYPESYYSLSLRYKLYQYYQDNGEPEKSRIYSDEIKRIMDQRGIELLVGPDSRYSTPENTIETFRAALMEDNLEAALECFVPSSRARYKKFFTEGVNSIYTAKEFIESMLEDTKEIERYSVNDRFAEYGILRMESGKVYSYPLSFARVLGEWKILGF